MGAVFSKYTIKIQGWLMISNITFFFVIKWKWKYESYLIQPYLEAYLINMEFNQ